jgi:Transposase DDE domain
VSRPLQLTQWHRELKDRFPELPARVVFVLALYSFGVILAHVSGLSTVALFLSRLVGCSYHALRKRLSEFYKEASAKSGVNQGGKRQDFDVTTCFGPLLRWILSLWSGRHLALAVDVTNLGERFHVLCVSVVVAGVGIPVAWKVLHGGMKEPWNPHWEILLKHLKKAVPDGWTVIVLSDRGLESPQLFKAIKDQGWHPLMRVKKGGKFRPTGWRRFYYFSELVRQVGGTFYAEGRAYTGQKMACTLLACWNEGYDEPWLVLSDLPPEAGNAVWYAFRAWIEQGFKVIKGGGWDWEKTRMEEPGRVERLWLVLAVATLWVVAVGADAEAREGIQEALKKLEREMTQSQQQAQERLQRERVRLEKLKEALQARQARKRQREALRQQQREEARHKKKMQRADRKAQAAKEATVTTPTGQQKAKARTRTKKAEQAKVRIHRVSIRGLAVLSDLWLHGQNRLPQHLYPEPWPKPCHPVSTLSEAEFLSQQT